MSRMPSPPIVAAALSGFVVGVVLTLLATGAVTPVSHSSTAPPTLPPSRAVPDQRMRKRVAQIVVQQLGFAYPNPRISRLDRGGITLSADGPVLVMPDSLNRVRKYRSVLIQFQLNDHPLGPSFRLRAAKGDIFRVMRALYTSSLPVYNVEMDGYFGLKGIKSRHPQPVVVAEMSHQTAENIPWKRWGRENEGRLWALLPHKFVNPHFG